MDIYARVCDHLRTLHLQTPRVNSSGRQIIQEDREVQDNERDIAVRSVPTGTAERDLGRNRALPLLVQITIKNINQKQAYDDAWKIANSFDMLPRKENDEWVTLKSSDGSFLFETSETTNYPRNIGQSEHHAHYYVLTIRLNITLGGK